MKIAIIGFSGSGKSVLANTLGKYYKTEVLHLDQIHYCPNWETRSDKDQIQFFHNFLESHDAWIVDGNYPDLAYWRRMEEADFIIALLFGRMDCLRRAFFRYLKYSGTTRPDMANGCVEKFDLEFIWWILFQGRNNSVKMRYKRILENYAEKTIVLRNQKQIDQHLIDNGIETILIP